MSTPPKDEKPRDSRRAEFRGTLKLLPSGERSAERLWFFQTLAVFWALLKGCITAEDLKRLKDLWFRKTAAEAAKKEAEVAKIIAEAGKNAAEAAKTAAEAAKIKAGVAKIAAEAAKIIAEAGKNAAEAGKIDAESTLMSAEEVKELAEALEKLRANGRSVEFADEMQTWNQLLAGACEFPEDPVIGAVVIVNWFLDRSTPGVSERRNAIRFSLSSKVEVSSDKNMPTQVGECCDVCEGGLYAIFSGDPGLTVEQDVIVRLENVDATQPLPTWDGDSRRGKIVRTHPLPANPGPANRVGIAIEFEESLDASQERDSQGGA